LARRQPKVRFEISASDVNTQKIDEASFRVKETSPILEKPAACRLDEIYAAGVVIACLETLAITELCTSAFPLGFPLCPTGTLRRGNPLPRRKRHGSFPG
jgi:hypothetical protein